MSAWYFGEHQEQSDVFGINRAPAYWGSMASGSYRISKHLFPFLRVENVTNSRYQEVLGYNNISRSIRGGTRLEW